jgi:hypothetical protein
MLLIFNYFKLNYPSTLNINLRKIIKFGSESTKFANERLIFILSKNFTFEINMAIQTLCS